MSRSKSFLVLVLALIRVSTLWSQDYELELIGQWHDERLPDLRGQVYNDIWGWESPEGREYVILGSLDSTYFIEVTFPDKPVVRDIVAGQDSFCVHRDYKVYNNYCYAVADEGYSTLQIIDMSYLPDSVHVVYDSDEISMRAHNVFIADDRVFLASNLHNKWGHIPMSVLKLDKRADRPYPIHHLGRLTVDSVDLFNHVHDVYARDGIAYCSNGPGGLYIYDYSDQSAGLQLISSLTSYPDQGYNHSSWLSDDGNTLVMADETHGMRLKLVDLSDIESPEVISTFGMNSDLGSIPHNPFILGDLCFISYYHEGLVVYDISDPEKPELAAQYDTYPQHPDSVYAGYEGCWGTYPYFTSGTIVASDMSNGLFIFKLKGWESPLEKNREKEQELFVQVDRNKVSIQFKEAYNDQVVLEAYDLKGRMVWSTDRSFTGLNMEVGIPELALGTYIYRIETTVGVEMVKSVKIF